MKYIATAFFSLLVLGTPARAQETAQVQDETDRVNYSLGYQIGGDFKRQGVEIRPELVVKGIQDALSEAEPMITQEEMDKALVDLKRKIVADEQAAQKKASDENLAAGRAFLEENSKKEGVKTLPSGLQYRVIKEGTGAIPSATDTVTVHYRGTLIDGTEFDSSYSREEPATFQANRVIDGWKEALQLMKAGGKWQLFIPAELAYGARSVGDKIKSNSTLIFEVELLSVQKNEGRAKKE
jgi:FKBP-type peptidyl-prolyl cis-trans isomerase FklB